MRAIKTTYLGWTNTRRARIKASTGTGASLTVSTSTLVEGTMEEQHATVATRLATGLGWLTPVNYLVGGCYKNDYYFVFSDSDILSVKEEEPS